MKNETSSVDKNFVILGCFAEEHPEWTATELPKEMESRKSSVYHSLSDMEKRGGVHQDQKTGSIVNCEEHEIELICAGVLLFNQSNELVSFLIVAGSNDRFKEQDRIRYFNILQIGAKDI